MVLILSDEFDGPALDENLWKSLEYGQLGMKHNTLRGPDNLEVKDGNLLLHVRRESKEHDGQISEWTAGYVYTHSPIENNVYIEARFKPGKASGVNNAFWLACVGKPRHTYLDRYEIDIIESRKDVRHDDNTGHGHMAWHDWKTFGYIIQDNGKHNHIAQGFVIPHTWDDYHIWGLWYGESEFIFYLNGQEVWRGDTHPRYTHQWRTGVGKFDHWYDNEEKRAYGNFGQDDWSYLGGYNGDRMHIVFSNIPWGSSWSPLTDDADGDVMAVDYLRVYKPKRLLTTKPVQRVAPETLTGGKPVALDQVMPIQNDHPWFFSLPVRKEAGAQIHLDFEDANGGRIFSVGIDNENHLLAGFKTQASTATAYPASENTDPFFEDNKDYLLVGRVTPSRQGGKPAVSLSALPLPLQDIKEPYFYRNVDRHGNTSFSQGWHINQKDDLPKPSDIHSVRLRRGGVGSASIDDLKIGVSYPSVLPRDHHADAGDTP